jgi:hypothetical protein
MSEAVVVRYEMSGEAITRTAQWRMDTPATRPDEGVRLG